MHIMSDKTNFLAFWFWTLSFLLLEEAWLIESLFPMTVCRCRIRVCHGMTRTTLPWSFCQAHCLAHGRVLSVTHKWAIPPNPTPLRKSKISSAPMNVFMIGSFVWGTSTFFKMTYVLCIVMLDTLSPLSWIRTFWIMNPVSGRLRCGHCLALWLQGCVSFLSHQTFKVKQWDLV